MNYLRGNEFWTEAKVYATVVWAVVVMGVGNLGVGLTQPIALLAIAAVLNRLVDGRLLRSANPTEPQPQSVPR